MPLINVHEHLQSMTQVPVLLQAMDSSEIGRVVLLGSSAFTITSDYRRGFSRYHENNLEIIKAAAAHPGRIEAWPTLNPVDSGNAARLRSYHELGASGLKLYIGHGFVAPDSGDYVFSPRAMDDPCMDDVYGYCAAHRLPVCLHVNPTRPGFADEFTALLMTHPRLLVNAPHWILSTTSPERLAELLEAFPNLVTDISFGHDDFLVAGLRRISKHVAPLRAVVVRHPDRFMFGTDFVITSAPHKTTDWMRIRIAAYTAMLSHQKYETPLIPSRVLNGLALPSRILDRVRSGNYLGFRAPDRRLTAPGRPVDWSRLGVRRHPRGDGERLRHEVAADPAN